MGSMTGTFALVTGGGTGLGYGCAAALAAEGATVTICGRRAEVLEAAAETLRLDHPAAEIRTAVCDVTDESQLAAAVAQATGPDGQLDACVVSAGSGTGKPVLLMGADDLRQLYEANVIGAFLTIKQAALAMRDHGGGSIVAISSIAGVMGGRFRAAYASSKAALDMLVKVSADELGPLGIRVNSVRPGLVPSEATSGLTSATTGPLAAVRQDYVDNMPLGRVGTPDDIGDSVAFLCSPRAGWITGQHLNVDGGHTIRRAPNMEAALRAAMGDETMDRLAGPRWPGA